MIINYNVTGTERKRLADYISSFMGTDKKYLGASTFAYQIGYLTVSKDGAVSFEDQGYNSDIDALMAELGARGSTPRTPSPRLTPPSRRTPAARMPPSRTRTGPAPSRRPLPPRIASPSPTASA